MKISDNILEQFSPGYPLESLAPLEKLLFLDIETTGLSPKSSLVYLIGCAYYRNASWHTVQWLSEAPQEEASILTAFFQFAQSFSHVVHFNGNQFDLPFLTRRCEHHSLPFSFAAFEGLDLYKRIAFCKSFLKLLSCKQKNLEHFLGIHREDPFSGGELIEVYEDYVLNPSEPALKALLLHNAEDLKGMLAILPMLAYYDLLCLPVRVKKAQANYYRTLNGDRRQELLLTLSLPSALPKAVSASANDCYFTAEGSTGSLKIPVYEEEMKYFYSNYKDYYYLPREDVALHKSVASFVDREYRIPATAATCYTRKQSVYLRQWSVLVEPFFKRDYRSKELFFELTDELKKDRDTFHAYASHVLTMIAESC